ncbi:MAG: transposase [Myxococcaceae bacterium]|nr:transposase [Myxococcaceae bacterium]
MRTRLSGGVAGVGSSLAEGPPLCRSIGVQVFVALEAVDLRSGFERLAGFAQQHTGYDARCGALFVFIGRRGTAAKVLFFDGTGMCTRSPVGPIESWAGSLRALWHRTVQRLAARERSVTIPA